MRRTFPLTPPRRRCFLALRIPAPPIRVGFVHSYSFAWLAAALLGAFAGPADACRDIQPALHDTERYAAIFVGVVTGIHLVGHERALLGVPDGELDGKPLTITGGSSEVRVTAVPRLVATGSADGPQSFGLTGCATSLPGLRERGLFFVALDGGTAVAVWESSEREFAEALRVLRISRDAL